MKRRVRTVSAGLSVGIAALAAMSLVATPAEAAARSLKSQMQKSQKYCDSLPHRTSVDYMKKAQCDAAVLAAQQWVVAQTTSGAMSETQAVQRASWPGP
ncbi:hypothetical protein [Streptomyces adustus]|uniref:hypothetical protein n=1 Tax=Streptomyces adustus TaxID=1609272 RepID=UPI003717F227